MDYYKYWDDMESVDVVKKDIYIALVENAKIITKEQFDQIMGSLPIKTYIELRSLFKMDEIKQIRTSMGIIYYVIETVGSASAIDNTFITRLKISSFIPATKDELLHYASIFDLSVAEDSSKDAISYAVLGVVLLSPSYVFYRAIEKAFFNKDKKGIPDKLSDMTPIQIASKISGDMKKLSGPVSAFLLVPKQAFIDKLGRNPPVMMLLGDYHNSDQRCDADSAYSLYTKDPTFLQYLSRQAKTSNWMIDLFLEIWLSTKARKENSIKIIKPELQKSALLEVSILTSSCISQRKEDPLRKSCFFTEFRTHSADIRQMTDFDETKYNGDNIWILICNIFGKETYGTDVLKQIQILKAFLKQEYKLFSVETIMENLIHICNAKNNVDTVTRYFESPFFKKYSRTLHDFYQLPDFLQTELKEQLLYAAEDDKTYNYILTRSIADQKILEPLLSNINVIFKTGSAEYITYMTSESSREIIKNTCYSLERFSSNLGKYLMDIYTVSRALKHVKTGLPSQLSIVYEGYSHIADQLWLLNNFYDVVCTWGIFRSYSKERQQCITINTELSNSFLNELPPYKKTYSVRLFIELYKDGKPINTMKAIRIVQKSSAKLILACISQAGITLGHEGLPFLKNTDMKRFSADRYVVIDYEDVPNETFQSMFTVSQEINHTDDPKVMKDLRYTIRYGDENYEYISINKLYFIAN